MYGLEVKNEKFEEKIDLKFQTSSVEQTEARKEAEQRNRLFVLLSIEVSNRRLSERLSEKLNTHQALVSKELSEVSKELREQSKELSEQSKELSEHSSEFKSIKKTLERIELKAAEDEHSHRRMFLKTVENSARQ